MNVKRRLLLLMFGVTLAVLIAEGALLALGVFAPPGAPEPFRPDLYQASPFFGYTLRPSTTVKYRYPVGSLTEVTLRSNSDGFRNAREFMDEDPRPRVWLLGDSMVLGDGVEADDRLTEEIERREPRWRVDNVAMTGWGLDLMVRAYERLSSRRRPELVVLAFYTDDFRRLRPRYAGMGYALPKFELEDGRLVDMPFPAPLPLWRRLRVVQAAEQTYWRFARNRYDLNGALLRRLQAGVAPSRLAVVFVPGRGDTTEDQQRRFWLSNWCQGMNVPFLDLTSTMHGAGLEAIHLPDNPHWNSLGHKVAGAAIHEFLKNGRLMN